MAYEERVTSWRTEMVFIGLAVVSLAFFLARMRLSGLGILAGFFLLVCCFFAFYAANYRVLVIREAPGALELTFGLLKWAVSWESLEACGPDDVSLWRIGGAGIHFTPIGGRYRVYLNFLEHPRVVLNLRPGRRLVRAVAFSTRRPADVLALVGAKLGERGGVHRNEGAA
jgi:hypothetical protein